VQYPHFVGTRDQTTNIATKKPGAEALQYRSSNCPGVE
jgi:hypothetical protein